MGYDVKELKKIPKGPAARMLANAGIKLETKLDLPTVASVEEYLAALDERSAVIDMLRLLSVTLPAREAVWWACLAATDVVGEGEENTTPSLAAARAWVYQPDADNREAVRVAMEAADHDDDTAFCAMAAYYGDGTAGAGEMAEHPAPPAAVASAVLAQNILAMTALEKDPESAFDLLIRRGLDIARGGNGKVAPAEQKNETEDV